MQSVDIHWEGWKGNEKSINLNLEPSQIPFLVFINKATKPFYIFFIALSLTRSCSRGNKHIFHCAEVSVSTWTYFGYFGALAFRSCIIRRPFRVLIFLGNFLFRILIFQIFLPFFQSLGFISLRLINPVSKIEENFTFYQSASLRL